MNVSERRKWAKRIMTSVFPKSLPNPLNYRQIGAKRIEEDCLKYSSRTDALILKVLADVQPFFIFRQFCCQNLVLHCHIPPVYKYKWQELFTVTVVELTIKHVCKYEYKYRYNTQIQIEI